MPRTRIHNVGNGVALPPPGSLRKAPEQRYGSVERFGDDLRHFLASEPIAGIRSRAPGSAWAVRKSGSSIRWLSASKITRSPA